MKPLTRNISLLLVCGLMLPLHQNETYIIGKNSNVHLSQSKPVGISQVSDCRHQQDGFSFFKDVLANILPALKNLR